MPIDAVIADERPDDPEPPGPPDEGGAGRDRIGAVRDRMSETRGRAAEARDDSAEARDENAELRDRIVGTVDSAAASDRAGARQDRLNAARDRASATADSEASASDRILSARERAASSFDGLTGAYRRDAGAVELERDIGKAKRTGTQFVLAFVDIDGLKATNDTLGHASGDRLLRLVADTLRAHLRSYDLVVRFGGDEFVCGLLDVSIEEATARFALITADLAESQDASVSAGFAELSADDSLAALLKRADDAMYTKRTEARSGRARGA